MPRTHDEPIQRVEDDLIGVRHVVRQIARLIEQADTTESLRLGVYGAWGSGKTSALALLEQRLRGERMLCVRFSPWGCGTDAEMFAELLVAVTDALIDKGGKARGKELRKLMGTVLEVAEKTRAGEVIKLVRSWLGDARAQLTALRRTVDAKAKVVVLVDDLDRADPARIPPLMFAIREVLGLEGFFFVLSMDPQVVAAAMQAHHPGFGDGRQFLDKIVQFGVWLPDLRTLPDSKRAMIEQELRGLDDRIIAAVVRVAGALPDNPRALKATLRTFASLDASTSRFHSWELRWDVLVLLSMFKALHPDDFVRFARDDQLLAGLDAEGAQRFLTTIERPALVAPILAALDSAAHPAREAEAGLLAQHVRWLISPPILTMKEFYDWIDAGGDHRWLVEHARRQELPMTAVIPIAWAHASAAYLSRSLGPTGGADSEPLVVALRGIVAAYPAGLPVLEVAVVAAITRLCLVLDKFTGDELAARHALIDGIVDAVAEDDVLAVARALQERSVEVRHSSALERIRRRVEALAMSGVIARHLWFWRLEAVLLEPELLWTPDVRAALRAHLAGCDEQPGCAHDCLMVLERVLEADPLRRLRFERDADLVALFWNAANARPEHGMTERLGKVHDALGARLTPLPPWWDRATAAPSPDPAPAPPASGSR